MRYLLLCSGTYSDSIRSGMALERFIKDNNDHVDIEYYTKHSKDMFSKHYDLVILSRPNNPKFIYPFKSKRIPVLVDIDDDFWNIPKKHVGYNHVGPGNEVAIAGIEECLKQAHAISTSTENLQIKLKEKFGDKVFIIDNGWNSDNDNWNKSLIKRNDNVVNIGWAGTITHREDFKLCLNALIKITDTFKESRILIGGDPDIYLMLNNINENQKMFLPPVEYFEFPAIVGSFDILLAPLLENPFNAAKSDIKLVDAGARKIPWVASRAPNYLKWYEGGEFASTTDEWVEHISEFIRGKARRRRYGEAGYQKALTRESKELIKLWITAIEAARYNAVHEKL